MIHHIRLLLLLPPPKHPHNLPLHPTRTRALLLLLPEPHQPLHLPKHARLLLLLAAALALRSDPLLLSVGPAVPHVLDVAEEALLVALVPLALDLLVGEALFFETLFALVLRGAAVEEVGEGAGVLLGAVLVVLGLVTPGAAAAAVVGAAAGAAGGGLHLFRDVVEEVHCVWGWVVWVVYVWGGA